MEFRVKRGIKVKLHLIGLVWSLLTFIEKDFGNKNRHSESEYETKHHLQIIKWTKRNRNLPLNIQMKAQTLAFCRFKDVGKTRNTRRQNPTPGWVIIDNTKMIRMAIKPSSHDMPVKAVKVRRVKSHNRQSLFVSLRV